MVRIIFHRQKCIGCNACVEALPIRWRVSKKDGRCNLIGSTEKRGIYHVKVDAEELEANQIAAKNCPVNVIKVEVV
jgi:ferredoxin